MFLDLSMWLHVDLISLLTLFFTSARGVEKSGRGGKNDLISLLTTLKPAMARTGTGRGWKHGASLPH